ncbi:hypothetical protein OIU77_020782 [Salix suchowensis]|uniref:Pentatricopeptide repeat-containing protein n=1 Tax=Salix suchowensis TaxID=1278906 RepID=A0ABQ9C7K8_9ROSI|nr:hypothetical protein OIU77_020782 [Salix suchowensis]
MGFGVATYASNSLMNMYFKSGMIRDARAVFDSMTDRNAVSWNSMVAGLVTNGLHLETLDVFYHMRLAGVKLTKMVFAPVIKLCGNIKELASVGKWTVLSRYFSVMGDEVRNVVSWTAMISGYLQNGMAEQAVNLFCQMSREGVRPNDFTYSTILTAQADAYVKRGNVVEASKVFQRIEEKDIVAWSAMISGYAQIGDTEGAVRIFVQMAKEGVKPNEYTFSGVINACAAPTAGVEQGKQLHAWSIKSRFNNALCVSSALLTMYSKRGDIESAFEVFKRQRERDLVSWNSIISGYAQHGYGRKALEVFEEMQRQNLEMDGITFIGVISACTHTGLTNDGQRYFDIMVNDHHIEPRMEHYSCMVDLYGRAGMLVKAMEIINEMPFPASANVWRTLLAASCVHRNLELGKLAADKLISLQPQNPASYVLLTNMYASVGDWKERAKVRKLMEEKKVKKVAGYSWIEVKNKTYTFLAGDVSHPLSNQIYAKT